VVKAAKVAVTAPAVSLLLSEAATAAPGPMSGMYDPYSRPD
jgi:hypothetical protein